MSGPLGRYLVCAGMMTGALALGSCGKHKSSDTRLPLATTLLPTGPSAPVASDKDGVVVASLDPNSKDTQTVQGSAGSKVANILVGFPPGSLSLATNITLKEAMPVGQSKLVSSLGLDGDTKLSSQGIAVQITSSKPLDLSSPMVIALSLPDTAGLADFPKDRTAVVYRVGVQGSGQNLIGVVPLAQLSQDSSGRVLYPSKFFGIFQVVVFDRPVGSREAKITGSLHEGLQLIADDASLPSCGSADIGSIVYVQGTKKFQTCTSNGWTAIDLSGPAGPAGAAGSAGAAGAATGGAIYDSTGRSLGEMLGTDTYATTILFSNGGFGGFYPDGTFFTKGIYGYDLAGCYYTTSDCTGTCYLSSTPIKGQIIRISASVFNVLTGTESSAGTLVLASRTRPDMTCSNGGATVPAWTITNSVTYTFPSGLSYPFAVPFHFVK